MLPPNVKRKDIGSQCGSFPGYRTVRTYIEHRSVKKCFYCEKGNSKLKVEIEVNLRPIVKLSSGAHDQIFVFCQTTAGFLMWGVLSDERMSL
jgi:hypothetical protein